MRMPPLPADSIHARACKLKCEKILTRPGLEHPDDLQEVISLILQGAAARYACCPNTQEHTNRPLDVCWDHIRLAVSHINISEENTVKVTFQQVHRERTEHGTDSTEAGTDHTGNEKC